MGRSLGRRALVAAGSVALVVTGVLVVPHLAGAQAEPDAGTTPAHDHVATAHLDEMRTVARAEGLEPASDQGMCAGAPYQFRTRRGLRCATAPMLEHMFTPQQLAEATTAPAVASADAAVSSADKVSCLGDGTDGKRFQLVYARRSGDTDRYAATAPKVQGWAATIDQTLQASAAKTGGNRQARWVTDPSCNPTVLNITVGSTVSTFAQLVDALEAKGLTSRTRKYLVAWDDSDGTEPFCGLGQYMPDATAGPTNANETQPIGGLFAAVQPQCWTSAVAAHELMHTLGAVQAGAPHATRYGHCTDESDLLCYVDGAGTVTTQVCPASQESLYDCNNDDYFSTRPPSGSYLAKNWNTATSGWLDPNPPPKPGYSPFTSWSAFVDRQHQDVLGRRPTASESSTWVADLQAGRKTRGQLVDALRRSAENTTNVDPTARLYRAFLGRAPDASGLRFWIGRRRAGTWSLTRMADSFAASTEFTNKYGTLTNRQFVTRIYTDVLGRAADTSGVNYWTGKLDRRERTRGSVMVGFSESSEYKRKQAENTDASVAFIFVLGRVPTATETSTWVGPERNAVPHATLLEELLGSGEYATRVARG
jgi:hypothetical protein